MGLFERGRFGVRDSEVLMVMGDFIGISPDC